MATYTWTGAAGDNNFNNPNNWSPAGVPGSADTAVISTSAAATIGVSNDTIGALTLGAKDTLSINDNNTLTIGSGTGSTTVSNAGTILLDSQGNDGTGLQFADTLTTLTGGGQIVLNNGGNDYIYGASTADTLSNVNNTISGSGRIGLGSLTLINGASGTINANVSNSLLLSTGTTTTNSGLIEATGSGGLVIQSSVNNGTLGHVSGLGGIVSLNGATIQGGTLSSSGAGQININNGTLDGSAHAVTNTGSIQVDDNNAVTVLGTLANSGTITIASGGNDGTGFIVGSGTVTLSGTGTLTTTTGGNNYIEAAAAGDVLKTSSNLLLAGNFGEGTTLTVINTGIINANQAQNLNITLASTLTNDKLLEETSSGGLTVQANTTILNASGTIAATGAGGVVLQGGDIVGGVLTSSAGSFYSNNGTLDGMTDGAITTSAGIQVDDNNILTVLGTLDNTGVITVASAGNDGTGLYFDSATVTLTGGGVVTTTDDGNPNFFEAASASDVLDNVNNTLNISGNFGNGQLSFINNGTVDADQTHALTLDLGGSFTNNALVEETSTGGIVVASNTVISNAGGTVAATGTGGISLNNGTIAGGVITSGKGGGFYSNNGVLDGSSNTITSSAYIQVDDNNSLFALGTISNAGTIEIASGGNDGTALVVDSPTLTLTGGGVVTTTAANNYIYGANAGATLNNVNNTFDISGNFGNNSDLTFINGGVVNADLGQALTLELAASFINNKLLEETGGGGIVVNANTSISNAHGTVSATGTGGISLNGGTIVGGVLTSGAGGGFYSNGGTLDGSSSTITSTAYIQVDDNNNLYLLGSISNGGTIEVASGGNDFASLIVDSPTLTLTGRGVVTTTAANNYIYAASSGDVLNNVNNTFDISGNFGNDSGLVFINGGVVDDNSGQALTLRTNGTFTNNNLVEETSTGGIVINGDTTISNGKLGTVAATGAGGITLNSGTIAGGFLTSGPGGGFYSNNGTLDGTSNTITSTAYIQGDDNENTYLLGSISNGGTIEVASGGNDFASLIVDSPTLTLTGGGLVTTTTNNNYIYAANSGDVLNNVNNTFDISGNFGNNSGLVVVNGGIFEAGLSQELYVETGAAFTNSGQIIASGSGGLDLRNVVLTNTSTGTIAAMGGSTLVSESSGTLTNDSSAGTLSGGTYEALANANAATLNFNGHAVVSLAADVVLSGTGSEISFGGVAIETDLAMISKTGELQVLAGRAYTSKKIITNYGTVALGGGSFKPYGFNSAPGSVVSGFGTIASKFNDNGTLTAVGGTLDLASTDTVNGAVTGTGTLAIGGATTLGTKTTLSVSNIALLSKATLDLGTSVSFAGTFNVTGAATLDGTGTFTNTGLFESTGKGVGTISAAVANSGTISVASGSSLAFSGGLANSGLILDSGTFTDTAALTGGSLTLGGTSSHATIATATGTGNSTLATLTSAGGDLNTSGTTITVTGDYDNTAAGTGNSYDPFKGVTGTIDANGTQLAVVGVDGTTISSVNGTLTIAIAAHGKASFVIENAGPAGDTLLRGALQTSVNGGSITSKSLSGTGVKAGNYGPLAGGSESGTYTIAYNGSAPLTGQAIHIASDFANVAGVTIDIVAQGAAPTQQTLGALPDAMPSASEMLVVPKG